MSRRTKITYIKGYKHDEDLLFPEMASKMVSVSFTKRFHNCLYLLSGLPACARDLIDYLAEIMDDNNLVENTELSRTQFIDFLGKITEGKVTYGHDMVKKSFRMLSDNELLIKKSRGLFRVNPEFFCKGGDQRRLELIQADLKTENID